MADRKKSDDFSLVPRSIYPENLADKELPVQLQTTMSMTTDREVPGDVSVNQLPGIGDEAKLTFHGDEGVHRGTVNTWTWPAIGVKEDSPFGNIHLGTANFSRIIDSHTDSIKLYSSAKSLDTTDNQGRDLKAGNLAVDELHTVLVPGGEGKRDPCRKRSFDNGTDSSMELEPKKYKHDSQTTEDDIHVCEMKTNRPHGMVGLHQTISVNKSQNVINDGSKSMGQESKSDSRDDENSRCEYEDIATSCCQNSLQEETGMVDTDKHVPATVCGKGHLDAEVSRKMSDKINKPCMREDEITNSSSGKVANVSASNTTQDESCLHLPCDVLEQSCGINVPPCTSIGIGVTRMKAQSLQKEECGTENGAISICDTDERSGDNSVVPTHPGRAGHIDDENDGPTADEDDMFVSCGEDAETDPGIIRSQRLVINEEYVPGKNAEMERHYLNPKQNEKVADVTSNSSEKVSNIIDLLLSMVVKEVSVKDSEDMETNCRETSSSVTSNEKRDFHVRATVYPSEVCVKSPRLHVQVMEQIDELPEVEEHESCVCTKRKGRWECVCTTDDDTDSVYDGEMSTPLEMLPTPDCSQPDSSIYSKVEHLLCCMESLPLDETDDEHDIPMLTAGHCPVSPLEHFSSSPEHTPLHRRSLMGASDELRPSWTGIKIEQWDSPSREESKEKAIEENSMDTSPVLDEQSYKVNVDDQLTAEIVRDSEMKLTNTDSKRNQLQAVTNSAVEQGCLARPELEERTTTSSNTPSGCSSESSIDEIDEAFFRSSSSYVPLVSRDNKKLDQASSVQVGVSNNQELCADSAAAVFNDEDEEANNFKGIVKRVASQCSNSQSGVANEETIAKSYNINCDSHPKLSLTHNKGIHAETSAPEDDVVTTKEDTCHSDGDVSTASTSLTETTSEKENLPDMTAMFPCKNTAENGAVCNAITPVSHRTPMGYQVEPKEPSCDVMDQTVPDEPLHYIRDHTVEGVPGTESDTGTLYGHNYALVYSVLTFHKCQVGTAQNIESQNCSRIKSQ
ncbi:hypothetical protein Bbelb_264180 [Branchiostoma belcheri]|nr:hypothetical protein Bbelb_264180 [Branchiostoma belcheri]